MRTVIKYWLVVVLGLLPMLAQAANNFPPQQTFAGQALTLNGEGKRTKAVFDLYHAGLYLTAKNHDAEAILAADQPMAMRLEITSGMITSENMEEAVREGFKKVGAGADLQPKIDQLIKIFQEEIKKGDIYDFIYKPSSTAIVKNGKNAATIQGAEFKQAFFGIWLGKNPAQASLKKSLLGQ